MAEKRTLRNPPLPEVLFDFRVGQRVTLSQEGLDRLRRTLKSDYPHEEHRHLFLQQKPWSPPEDTGLHGYWLRSEDECNIAQFREDGFTFNRLRPYTSWEPVTDEARRLWRLYVDVAGPTSVVRVGARYINHIQIPEPIRAYSKYFTAPLPVPPTLDTPLRSFLTRILTPARADGVHLSITQALVEDQDPDRATILLDIDAYVAREFDPSDPELWNSLERIRVAKNAAFFESITEKTARLFE